MNFNQQKSTLQVKINPSTFKENIKCRGCLEFQANQQAHMDYEECFCQSEQQECFNYIDEFGNKVFSNEKISVDSKEEIPKLKRGYSVFCKICTRKTVTYTPSIKTTICICCRHHILNKCIKK